MRRRRRHSCRSWRCGRSWRSGREFPVTSSVRGNRGGRKGPAKLAGCRRRDSTGKMSTAIGADGGDLDPCSGPHTRPGAGMPAHWARGNTGRRKGCRAGCRDDGRMGMMSPPAGQLPVGCLAGCRGGSRKGGGRVEGIRRRRAARQPGRGGSIGISISRGGNVSQKGRKGRRARSSEQARNCQRRAPAARRISATGLVRNGFVS